MNYNRVFNEDCMVTLKRLPDEFVQCIITSPPYWGLRDYSVAGQLGLEKSPEKYVDKLVWIFREANRVLKKDGTLWLNLGDSYVSGKSRYSSRPHTISGKARGDEHDQKPDQYGHEYLKDKDMAGIPWRVALALQKDGWYLRSDIIWHKPNPMPSSVKDRLTPAHEYLFLLSKSNRYYYDFDAIAEPIVTLQHKQGKYTAPSGWNTGPGRHDTNKGRYKKQDALGKNTYTGFNDRYQPPEKRNKRTVWTIPIQPLKDAHFATFPEKLIEPCVLAGTKPGDIIYDPFGGSGTTALVALRAGRKFILSELSPNYLPIINKRIKQFLEQRSLFDE